MPSNRRSNAQQKRRNNQSSKGRGKAQAQAPAIRRGSAAWDILAVVLIVIAVAMIVAIVSPTSAPVTRATGDALVACFGVGALLAIVLPRYLERAWRQKLNTARMAMIVTMVVGLAVTFVIIGMRNGFNFKAQ
jgi:cation transport ATPase